MEAESDSTSSYKRAREQATSILEGRCIKTTTQISSFKPSTNLLVMTCGLKQGSWGKIWWMSSSNFSIYSAIVLVCLRRKNWRLREFYWSCSKQLQMAMQRSDQVQRCKMDSTDYDQKATEPVKFITPIFTHKCSGTA